MSKKKKKTVDPLFQLFERYLFNKSYEDAAAFAKEIAEEYLAYLDSTPAHVPFENRQMLLKDLEAEAHEMLVKRMYGCVKPSEYENTGRVIGVSQRKTLVLYDLPEKKNRPADKR